MSDADGSTADGSKYVIPTGDGYLGVWKANGSRVEPAIGTYECAPWRSDTIIYAFIEENGIALVDEEPEDYIAILDVKKTGVGTNVIVPPRVLHHLDGFEPDSDVRAYERDEGGLLLVASANDPMILTDGGEEAQDDSDLLYDVSCHYCPNVIRLPTDDHLDDDGNYRCHNCEYQALHGFKPAVDPASGGENA